MKENNVTSLSYSFVLDSFGQNWRLQQDNVSKHTNDICKQFIDETIPQFSDWPSNSLEANPIENKRKPVNTDELEFFSLKNSEILILVLEKVG